MKNELRIGNYVLSDGIRVEVDGLGIGYEITTTANFEGSCNGKIEPIPLTEEWLVKFGFDNRLLKKIGDSDLYLQGDNADSLKEYGVYLSTDIGDGLCSEPNTFIEGFFYVHQLQNLYFALTQTELKIK